METALMLCKKRAGQIFPATMLALDPTANHHSSSSRLYTIVVSAFDEYTVAATQVRLPSAVFVRQYSFILSSPVATFGFETQLLEQLVQTASKISFPFSLANILVSYSRVQGSHSSETLVRSSLPQSTAVFFRP